MGQRQRHALGRAFELRRAEADEAERRSVLRPARKTDSGSSGRSPGNMAISLLPSKRSPSTRSPGSGVPMIEGSRSPRASRFPRASRAPRRARSRRPSRRRSGRGRWRAGRYGRRIASSRSWLRWCRWSALVAANRMRSIRRETRRAEPAPSARAGRQPRMSASAASRSATASGPPFSASQRVDQHDLAVEPGEMVAEERAGPRRSCRPRSAAPSSRRATRDGDAALAEVERREGERRRAVEVARHQEAARRHGRQARPVGADSPEIVGEQRRELPREPPRPPARRGRRWPVARARRAARSGRAAGARRGRAVSPTRSA